MSGALWTLVCGNHDVFSGAEQPGPWQFRSKYDGAVDSIGSCHPATRTHFVCRKLGSQECLQHVQHGSRHQRMCKSLPLTGSCCTQVDPVRWPSSHLLAKTTWYLQTVNGGNKRCNLKPGLSSVGTPSSLRTLPYEMLVDPYLSRVAQAAAHGHRTSVHNKDRVRKQSHLSCKSNRNEHW